MDTNKLLEVLLPSGVENLQLPDPALVVYYQNLENRIIWLDNEVDESCLDIIRNILRWNQEDKDIPVEERKPIRLFFFSPGGDLEVNNALIDTITLSKTPVWGINIGRCYSSAAYIFLSCHKRYCLEKAQLLFHQGSGAFSGTYQEIVPQIMAYQEQIEKLAVFVAERSTYSPEEVAENITSDWYVTVEEGLEHKIYDKKIDDINDLLY